MERILKFLNRAIQTFAINADSLQYEPVLDKILRPICADLSLNRISIWRKFKKDGKDFIGEFYLWTEENNGVTASMEELTAIPFENIITRWADFMKRGEPLNTVFSELPEDEQNFFGRFGLKTALATPVFRHDSLEGFMLFEDTKTEQKFYPKTVDALGSIALMCYNLVVSCEDRMRNLDAQTLMNFMVSTSPIASCVFNGEFRLVECNDVFRERFQLEQGAEQDFCVNFSNYCPRYQPDGRESDIWLRTEIYGLLTGTESYKVFDWLLQNKEGTPLPSEVHIKKFRSGDNSYVVIYIYDVRHIKAVEAELHYKLKNQELLAEFTKSLIDDGNATDLIENAFRLLGEALDADNVAVFRSDWENRCCKLEQFWCVDGYLGFETDVYDTLDIVNSCFNQRIPLTEQMRTILCKDFDLPDNRKFGFLKEYGVTAIIWCPIYISGGLWGVFSVESVSDSCDWDNRTVELIESMAPSVSSAIARGIANKEREVALNSAIQASKAKGDFLSNMSHEMRTPMNAIIGMTQIGKTASDIERKDYAFKKIEDASTHLLGVINDVLDMSKIEANRLELVESEFNFERMLKKVIGAMGLRIEDKNQSLFINIDGRIPHYLINDDQRLAQVIINLLSNATKFTGEKGSIHINADLLSEEDGVCTVQISVSDNGIGMTDEQLSRLFHAFAQADSGIARKFGGTGLGLVISRRIVELMQGDMTVSSEYGKGSEFRFTFKARRGSRRNEKWLDPEVNWDGMTVLVVDDASEVLEYFSALMEKIGIKCDVAGDGTEALQRIDGHGAYDVYFVDWKMPGINGIELTRIIKSQNEAVNHKSIVIMISSTEWSIIKDEAAKAGVDKYLLKPLFASNIVDCLNTCLGLPHKFETEARGNSPGELSHCRFLLAEDVEINREIFTSIMEESGAVIECAVNGIEALQMFVQNPDRYDIIFMDVQMPDMDGLEATRRIRSIPHPNAAEVPIVAMTANVFKEDIEACLAAGMDDHLGKPFNMDEVWKKIHKYT